MVLIIVIGRTNFNVQYFLFLIKTHVTLALLGITAFNVICEVGMMKFYGDLEDFVLGSNVSTVEVGRAKGLK